MEGPGPGFRLDHAFESDMRFSPSSPRPPRLILMKHLFFHLLLAQHLSSSLLIIFTMNIFMTALLNSEGGGGDHGKHHVTNLMVPHITDRSQEIMKLHTTVTSC